jgi:hypothetical protein
MRAAQLRYAFISTYNQTIFLRQEHRQGQWTLDHSRVIYSNARRATLTAPINGSISVRQCMWYMMHLAQAGYAAGNNTPMNRWVQRRP